MSRNLPFPTSLGSGFEVRTVGESWNIVQGVAGTGSQLDGKELDGKVTSSRQSTRLPEIQVSIC